MHNEHRLNKSTPYAGGTNSCFLNQPLAGGTNSCFLKASLRWRYKQQLSKSTSTLDVQTFHWLLVYIHQLPSLEVQPVSFYSHPYQGCHVQVNKNAKPFVKKCQIVSNKYNAKQAETVECCWFWHHFQMNSLAKTVVLVNKALIIAYKATNNYCTLEKNKQN